MTEGLLDPTTVKPNKQQKPKPTQLPAPAQTEIPPHPIDHKKEEIVAVSSLENDKQGGESVTINSPPPDASIAEAKPVALSVAGIGGVASAKPVRLTFLLLLRVRCLIII